MADKPLLLMTAFQSEQVQLPRPMRASLHHQALLKVGLLASDMAVVSEYFGVASATLAYRQGQQNDSQELMASGNEQLAFGRHATTHTAQFL